MKFDEQDFLMPDPKRMQIRELDMLQMKADGISNREIARQYALTPQRISQIIKRAERKRDAIRS